MIYLSLFFNFFKIGLFTFGGGYAMIPLISQVVTAKGWVSAETFIDYIAVAESTPGPIAVNTATFIGNDVAGFFGALCATLGVVLPSFIVILIIARFFKDFKDKPVVRNALNGLRPAVVGLVGVAALNILLTALKGQAGGFVVDVRAAVIFAFVFVASHVFKKIHPIALIVLSAAMGVLFFGVLF